jgi:hypothetical protein
MSPTESGEKVEDLTLRRVRSLKGGKSLSHRPKVGGLDVPRVPADAAVTRPLWNNRLAHMRAPPPEGVMPEPTRFYGNSRGTPALDVE